MLKHLSTLQKRAALALILANLFVFSLHVNGGAYAPQGQSGAQGSGRAITRESAPDNEPVIISDIRVRGNAVRFGERFDGDDTWLREITFRVKNRSNKPITYLQLDFLFPETRATGPVLLQQLLLGRRSDINSTLSNEPLLLMPNESLEVSLASQLERFSRLIQLRYPSLGHINEVAINLNEAMFEDGTLYSGGAIFRRNPDPNSPRRWIIVTEENNY